MLIWVVVISIGTVAAPSFAELHRRGEFSALARLDSNVRRAATLVGAVPILVMLLFPHALLELVGPGFGIAAPALVIMALGQLANCVFACQDTLLAMTGHGDTLRRLSILQFAVSCLLAATLVPLFGLVGAAVQSAVYVSQNAIGAAIAARRLLPRRI
jgi:O-antigen/teichoic acid export membrane protein